MATKLDYRRILTTGAALIACAALFPGNADARSVAGALGRSNTPEVNGVKYQDCVSTSQNGSIMNVCPVSIGYHMPVPIDTAGKKSVRIMAKGDKAAVQCTVWATDEAGGTLVLAQGFTATLGSPQPIIINSHPVPDGGRMSLYCVVPPRSVIFTVNYAP